MDLWFPISVDVFSQYITISFIDARIFPDVANGSQAGSCILLRNLSSFFVWYDVLVCLFCFVLFFGGARV
jgi:hypothetical protein